VVKRLEELHQQHVISYRKRSDSPTATFLTPRADAQRMVLDPAALAQRQQRALHRLKAMIAFVEEDDECRARRLIRYFGEEVEKDCGTCDVCRSRLAYDRSTHSTTGVAEPTGLSVEAARLLRWELDEEAG
jgi:superfamily II DNA helicase RecQ